MTVAPPNMSCVKLTHIVALASEIDDIIAVSPFIHTVAASRSRRRRSLPRMEIMPRTLTVINRIVAAFNSRLCQATAGSSVCGTAASDRGGMPGRFVCKICDWP
jgi:hypothetical protein